jgi:hypothetical protein
MLDQQPMNETRPAPATERSARRREDGRRIITILFANASRPVPNNEGMPVFYVGRSPWVVEKIAGSIWERDLGNPFKVTPTTPRGQAVKLFAADLERRIAAGDKPVHAALNRIAKAALNNGTVILVCHCHPQACHSHSIAKTIANALQKMGHDVRLPQTVEIERAGRSAQNIKSSISR